ncbi:TadE family type IV pilus minor pilin, partial [Solicola sp. PLA-1-18]|uniref:TadE family type IV pilus minor pilin n=1 Tax=Solicola sp. PLA-1-18 TaxID=3380532 RepID=UPI003B77F7CF
AAMTDARRPSGTRPWAPRPPLRPDRGMVTAETAVVLPFVLVVAGLLVWVVGLGVTQVRLVDAAREGARSVARGDGEREVVARVRRDAPDGARVQVLRGAGTTEVVVSVRRGLDLPLLADAAGVRLRASSVSATEGGPDSSEAERS